MLGSEVIEMVSETCSGTGCLGTVCSGIECSRTETSGQVVKAICTLGACCWVMRLVHVALLL